MKYKQPSIITLALLLLVAFPFSFGKTDKPPIRIMPLGDSITQGAADTGSYRKPLWKLLTINNQTIDFVGSLKSNYPYTRSARSDFDMNHEGHWGWRTDEVLLKINGWAKKSTPDIVLLHLGSNDILQKQKNEATVKELRQIIIALRKHNPRIEIFLAQLIPMANKSLNRQVQDFNDLLPNMAQSVKTENSPVHIVDQYEGFDAFKDTYDGVHPNESGIKKMALKWYKALATISKPDM